MIIFINNKFFFKFLENNPQIKLPIKAQKGIIPNKTPYSKENLSILEAKNMLKYPLKMASAKNLIK